MPQERRGPGSESPYYCYAVPIAPGEGAERGDRVRLDELVRQSRRLVALRWAAAALLVVAVTLAHFALRLELPAAPLYGLAGAVLVYNALFRLALGGTEGYGEVKRRLEGARRLASFQLVADLAALAGVLHFSGGVENPFFVYFIFHMIIASILLRRRASFRIATLAVALFLGVALAEYSGLVRHHPLWPGGAGLYENPAYVLSVAVAFTSTMYLAVYFAGGIVEDLRSRDRELVSVTTSLERGTLELQEAYQRIKALEERKSDFLRTASHQLRSPLAAIDSLLDVVTGGYAAEPAKRDEMLERAHNRVDHMLSLLDDLLALSRLRSLEEADRIEAEPVDVCRLLREVEQLYEARAREKGVELRFAPPGSACSVSASPGELREALSNLVDNAINYTPSGGTVTCSAQLEGGRLTISVADTGIGIPEGERERVFEEFYRAPNAKEVRPHSTGLGLPIVKRTVEKWGGSVSVREAEGGGTRFELEFPAGGGS